GHPVTTVTVDEHGNVSGTCATVLWRRSGVSAAAVAHAAAALPNLQWLHCDTAGDDDLPLRELAARGVTITKTDAYTDAVAEWAVAAVFLAARNLADYVRASDDGLWHPPVEPPRLVT